MTKRKEGGSGVKKSVLIFSTSDLEKNVLKFTLESKQSEKQLIICHLCRKEVFSPRKISILQSIRTFFSAPLKASFTVEAALVLPLFLFVMIAALQYGVLMGTSVRMATAMAETGKQMALAAYVSKYGGDTGKAEDVALGAMTAAYAHYKVKERTGDTSSIKNANMALSSFLKEDEMIDLVLTYQISTPIASVRLPGNFFIQRAYVRAWTGRRTGNKENESGKDENGSGNQVYVTDTGKVYHKDEDCTYLNLSVKEVSMQSLDVLRNEGGEIYHACETCGSYAEASVYITEHGNRYHSTLSCRGLKRTVNQVAMTEIAGMRACSKCGG